MFRKNFILGLIASLAFFGCSVFGSLTSTTTISPQNSFVLGNNEHGTFSVKLTNVSNQPLQVELQPIGKTATTLQTVQPNETVKVTVPQNTAIIIKNNSSDIANVQLKVNGDTGLSMTYKK